jgi:hypothetical protein
VLILGFFLSSKKRAWHYSLRLLASLGTTPKGEGTTWREVNPKSFSPVAALAAGVSFGEELYLRKYLIEIKIAFIKCNKND